MGPRPCRLALVLLAVLLAAAATAADAPRHVGLGQPRIEGGALVVPLVVDDLEGVLAGDLDVVFDGEAVSALSARATDLLSGFLFLYNVVAGDTLKMAFAGAAPASGSGAFIELLVEPADADPGLAFALVSFNDGAVPVEYEPATVVGEGGDGIGQQPGSLGSLKRGMRQRGER